MKPLTKSEQDELRRLVSLVGGRLSFPRVNTAPDELAARIATVRAWTPLTRAGHDCKRSMLRTLTMVQEHGYSNDRYNLKG